MPKNPSKKEVQADSSDSRKTTFVCFALVLLTFIVFGQLHDADYIHFDDPQYIVENPHVHEGLTAESIKWAFTTGYASNWHPVTWLSHMLDWELFQDNYGMHHMTNVLLHVLNVLLVFFVFKRMTKGLWRSAFVAAVFAIHPVHVESVAWLSERKDALSTLFWFLTMGAWVFYTEKKSVKWYLLAIGAFAVGLMSKPMLVTLPCVLLLMDYWPLKRLEKFSRKNAIPLVVEKIPLFALAFASSVVTFLVQRKGGAVIDVRVISPAVRLGNSMLSYLRYIGKMILPVDLGLFYPYNWNNSSFLFAVAAVVVLAGITFLVLRLARRYRYLPVGWFWYVGTLVPVIGLVQVGMQAMADRYTYIPYIGLGIMVAWGFGDFLAKRANLRPAVAMAGAAVILGLTAAATVQASYWQNTIKLFNHTLAVTEKNGRIHNNICKVYNDRCVFYANNKNKAGFDRTYRKAVYHGLKAVQFDSGKALANSLFNLGTSYYLKGYYFYKTELLSEAMKCWHRAVQLDKELYKGYTNLGYLYHLQGRKALAIKYWEKALEVNPEDAFARENLEDTKEELRRENAGVK